MYLRKILLDEFLEIFSRLRNCWRTSAHGEFHWAKRTKSKISLHLDSETLDIYGASGNEDAQTKVYAVAGGLCAYIRRCARHSRQEATICFYRSMPLCQHCFKLNLQQHGISWIRFDISYAVGQLWKLRVDNFGGQLGVEATCSLRQLWWAARCGSYV